MSSPACFEHQQTHYSFFFTKFVEFLPDEVEAEAELFSEDEVSANKQHNVSRAISYNAAG